MTEYLRIEHMLDQVKTTLAYMDRFMNAYKAQPLMVNLARGIVADAGAFGAHAEAEAVREWVKSTVAYRLDPEGIEYLQDPVETLRTLAGDCDDMATLAGTLLACLGHTCEPLGVVWQGETTPAHAVAWDDLAQLVIDPVADVPATAWPPEPYILSHFVRAS